MGDLMPNAECYRSLVGKLNFLTHTRPDLCFVIQHFSQYLQKPTYSHMKVVFHLLRYLKSFADVGVSFFNSPDFSISPYYDSDWAIFLDTRRSITGLYVILGGSVISWEAKKQPVVSLSSAEAEYMYVSKVVVELVWLLRLLAYFNVIVSAPVPVYCDNQAAIHIAKNLVFHERTKHIEVDCHFIRTKLNESLVELHHVPTASQLADIFTKPLNGLLHHKLLLKFGVQAPSNLREEGGVGVANIQSAVVDPT
ncbi:secreted RxLR effector protein 161-like [Lycium barbarum]|uniref:secreted RxLR effector protein 161-like n=1 Tax=Lycium barbarum TaxID=112863 RepID=UPI00293E2D70|nr:secreted RxLR effector protein 161-like [Lycium barbarum]